MSTIEKLEEYLSKYASAEKLAKTIRRFNNETLKMYLETDSEGISKEWISDGHYFLTELCEILDPQLQDE